MARMTKVYTAQEMREAAERFAFEEDSSRSNTIVAMLRQAAAAMEREEKREKKFEYTAEYVKRRSGKVDSKCVYHFNSFNAAKRFKYYPLKGEKLRFIRREVGEWEEVTE